jgi:hypothetical protein
MNTITASTVTVQATSTSIPSTPCWFGEIVIFSQATPVGTEFAPAFPTVKDPSASATGYAPAEVALPFKQGRISRA